MSVSALIYSHYLYFVSCLRTFQVCLPVEQVEKEVMVVEMWKKILCLVKKQSSRSG